jgi:hypothetical protein
MGGIVGGGGGVGVEVEAPALGVGAKIAVGVSLGVGKTKAVGGAAPGRSQLMAVARMTSNARSQGRGRIVASTDRGRAAYS